MKHIRIGSLAGIKLDLHYTWVFIFFLLAYALAAGFFPENYPGLSKAEYWFVGGVSALFLFVSVLLHELSHSLVAKRHNIKVERITLFFFGGVASIHEENLTPKKELQTAIAGPLFSIFLAGFFYLIFKVSTIVYVTAVTHYLFLINFILAVFNMVPGFPLDGGRVFRALIWMYNKDIKKATWYAANMGKAFAIFLVIMGFFSIIFGGFGGLWFVFLGLFLLFIAELSYYQTLVKEILKGIKVDELMKRDFAKLSGNETVKELIKKYFMKYGVRNFPVVSKGRFIGMLDLNKLKKIPERNYEKVKVKDVLLDVKRVKKVSRGTDVYHTLVGMSKEGIRIFPVVEKGKLVGILSRDQLMNYVSLKMRFTQKF